MIPLSSESTGGRPPIVTLVLMAACVWVFVVVQPATHQGTNGRTGTTTRADRVGQTATAPALRGIDFTARYAVVPCEVTRNRGLTQEEFREVFVRNATDECASSPQGQTQHPSKGLYRAILYSMFLHVNVMHLVGNMLFLWVFGANIESRLGHLRFLGFYLATGFLATLFHVVAQPHSAIPLIGASGAVAGVMGAYLVLFPNFRVRAWLVFWIFRVRAKWFLVAWFASQFWVEAGSSIAWLTHVSGFAFGAAVAGYLRIARLGSARGSDRALEPIGG